MNKIFNKLRTIWNKNSKDISSEECLYLSDNYHFILKHLNNKFHPELVNEDIQIKSISYTESQMLNEQITYGSVEFMLNLKGFNVKHLIRDYREDWGDDGGWLISISSKENKWYAHIIEINYNSDIKTIVFDDSKGFPDYISFDTYSECIEYVKSFANKLTEDIMETLRDEFDYYSGKEDHNKIKTILSKYVNLTDNELWWIGIIFASTSTYESFNLDICRMKNIDKLKYTSNFLMFGIDKIESVCLYDDDFYFKHKED